MTKNEIIEQCLAKGQELLAHMDALKAHVEPESFEEEHLAYQREKLEQVLEDIPTFRTKVPRT